MGCTQSSPVAAMLKCPNDFPKQKFAQIIRLFDKLDTDGNHGADGTELNEIATLHVENKILSQRSRKASRMQQKTFDEQQSAASERERIKEVQQESAAERAKIARACRRDVDRLDAEVERLNKLSGDGKTAEFMKVLEPDDKDGHIDFWAFFEYMRTRTGDIKNIPASAE